MLVEKKIEETLAQFQYRRKNNHETTIPLGAFDLATAYESNSVTHPSGPLTQAMLGQNLEEIIYETKSSQSNEEKKSETQEQPKMVRNSTFVGESRNDSSNCELMYADQQTNKNFVSQDISE